MVCLLFGSFANAFEGGIVSVKADELSRQSNAYNDYYFGNVVPLREYIIKLGFDLDDEDDQNFLGVNFLDYYNQATADGIIKPCDNDILLAGDLNQGSSKWNSGQDYTQYLAGTHQLLAGKAYDYASLLFPSLYTPGDNSTLGTDRSKLVLYADYPDVEETTPNFLVIALNNYHFYANGTNLFNNALNSGMNAKTQFITYYNEAIDYYFGQNGKVQSKTYAFNALGKALHYISDIATPVHTGDQFTTLEVALGIPTIVGVMLGDPVALLVAGPLSSSIFTRYLNHTSFEDVAKDWANSYSFSNITAPLASYSISSIAESVTIFSSAYYNQVGGPFNVFVSDTTRKTVSAATIPYAVDACASVLVKFARDVGYRDVAVTGSYASTTGAGSYQQGTTVYINAGTNSGYTFAGWTVTSGSVTLANSSSASTSFTMPSTNVTVKANWNPVGTPGWVTYANSLLYPYNSWCEYRVPIVLSFNGGTYNSYAYFDNFYAAELFIGNCNYYITLCYYSDPTSGASGYIQYLTFYEIERTDDGGATWYHFWK